MVRTVRHFELVKDYNEVIKNVEQFHRDLVSGAYMVGKLAQFKEWFYLPELDTFGPSKYIGYNDMNSIFYNYGHRTPTQKKQGSSRLNGGVSTNRLRKWFREIDKKDPLYNKMNSKLNSLFSPYGKIPNKALQIYVPFEINFTEFKSKNYEEDEMSDLTSKDNDVRFAFDILLEEIEGTVELINQDGADAFKKNDYELATKIADQAKQVAIFRDKVKALNEQWSALYVEVFGEPIDSDKQRIYSNKLQRGLRTPESEYCVPILKSLSEIGGTGHIKDVLNMVYEKMRGMLNEYDHQPITSSPDTPRWYNAAQWCRYAMIKDGFLKSDSPHGVWEISDKGLQKLKGSCN